MIGLIDALADMTGQTGLSKRRRDDVTGDETAGNDHGRRCDRLRLNGQRRSLDKAAETTVSFTYRT